MKINLRFVLITFIVVTAIMIIYRMYLKASGQYIEPEEETLLKKDGMNYPKMMEREMMNKIKAMKFADLSNMNTVIKNTHNF